jgi:uncharacterized protein (TIGR00369 family)
MTGSASGGELGGYDLGSFAAELGIEVVAIDGEPGDRRVRARMAWRPELVTAGEIMHGGALMAFADTAGALCGALNARGNNVGTSESKTNFFRPLTSGHVHAVSSTLHSGRTSIVVQTELFDDQERRVAHVIQTQVVRPAS